MHSRTKIDLVSVSLGGWLDSCLLERFPMDRRLVPLVVVVLVLLVDAPARGGIIWLEAPRITSQRGLTTLSVLGDTIELVAFVEVKAGPPTRLSVPPSEITIERRFQVVDAPLGVDYPIRGYWTALVDSVPATRGSASAGFSLTGPAGLVNSESFVAPISGGFQYYSDVRPLPFAAPRLAEGIYTLTARNSVSFSLSPYNEHFDAETYSSLRIEARGILNVVPEPSSLASTLTGLGLAAGWALRRRSGRTSSRIPT